MVEITGVRWGVLFQRDGLDKEGMKQYFEDKGTQVEDIIDDEVELSDLGTENWSKHECTIFVLLTPKRMTVPMDIMRELHLLPIPNQKYLYMPVERDSWGA